MNNSGKIKFEDLPTVNSVPVMLQNGVPLISTGTTAGTPAAGNIGNLYIDETTNNIYRDTGSAWTKLGSGNMLQCATGTILATTGTTRVTTGTTTTIPPVTEGFQIWSQSFTPFSASSTLIILYSILISSGTNARYAIMSTFAGSTNIGSVVNYCVSTNLPYNVPMIISYQPLSTNTITLSSRIGLTASGTLSVQQYSGTTNKLGGAAQTEYVIMEIL